MDTKISTSEFLYSQRIIEEYNKQEKNTCSCSNCNSLSIDDLKLRKEINGYLHTRLKYLGIKTLDEVGKMTIKDVTRLGGVGDAILYDLKKVMIRFDIIFDWYEWRRVIVRYY